MGYLFTQIFFWMIVAAGSGVLTGWLVWGRRQEDKPDMNEECDRLRNSLNSVHAELTSCREKLASAEQPVPEAKPEPEVVKKPAAAPKKVAVEAAAPSPEKIEEKAPPAPVAAPPQEPAPEPAPTPDTLAEDESAPETWKPTLLAEPQGDKDDLQRIKGVGPKIEGILNELGIYHFSQIADFTEENVAWVNSHLRFKGRIQREKWIEQAKAFAAEK